MRENDLSKKTSDEIEAALSALKPVAASVDRDALMYQAGYQAALSTEVIPQRSRSRQTLVRSSTPTFSDAASPEGPARLSRRPRATGPRLRFWQAATAMMTAAAAALAAMLVQQTPTRFSAPLASLEPRATPDQLEPVAEIPEAATPATRPKPAPTAPEFAARPASWLLLEDPASNYFALRAAVLRRGVDRWPGDDRDPAYDASLERPRRASTVRSLLQEMLPQSPDREGSGDQGPGSASVDSQESIT